MGITIERKPSYPGVDPQELSEVIGLVERLSNKVVREATDGNSDRALYITDQCTAVIAGVSLTLWGGGDKKPADSVRVTIKPWKNWVDYGPYGQRNNTRQDTEFDYLREGKRIGRVRYRQGNRGAEAVEEIRVSRSWQGDFFPREITAEEMRMFTEDMKAI